jgi:hypothetical protein
MGRWEIDQRESSPDSDGARSSSHSSHNNGDMHWEQFEQMEDQLLRMCESLRSKLSHYNPGFGDRIQLSNFCEYVAKHSTLLNTATL